MLSASWEAAMIRVGEIDCICNGGCPIPPSSRPRGDCRRRQGGQVGGSGTAAELLSGGNPDNVPHTRSGTTAMANAVASFARMVACVFLQGGGCGDNGSGGVLELVVARAGSGRVKEIGRGEEEDLVVAQRQYCCVVGRWQMT